MMPFDFLRRLFEHQKRTPPAQTMRGHLGVDWLVRRCRPRPLARMLVPVRIQTALDRIDDAVIRVGRRVRDSGSYINAWDRIPVFGGGRAGFIEIPSKVILTVAEQQEIDGLVSQLRDAANELEHL